MTSFKIIFDKFFQSLVTFFKKSAVSMNIMNIFLIYEYTDLRLCEIKQLSPNCIDNKIKFDKIDMYRFIFI